MRKLTDSENALVKRVATDMHNKGFTKSSRALETAAKFVASDIDGIGEMMDFVAGLAVSKMPEGPEKEADLQKEKVHFAETFLLGVVESESR